MSDAVLYSAEEGVALITLNRPDRMNAVNYELLTGLVDAVRRAAEDPDIGCVVLTGAGRGFCGGGDLKDGALPPKEQRPVRLSAQTRGAVVRRGSEASRLLHEMPKLTIAMINGPVAGAGIGLASSCDLRFAGASASFVTAYERIGAAGDYGATWNWTRLLGGAKARELFFIPRNFSAEEALAFGLYTRVFEDAALWAHTMELARRIAAGTGASWAYLKANLNAADTMPFADHLDLESLHMALSMAAHAATKKDHAGG
jgi:2-(1,2-epoxy-1,2-dihydrophenyl)acetyl-CoA isomerase